MFAISPQTALALAVVACDVVYGVSLGERWRNCHNRYTGRYEWSRDRDCEDSDRNNVAAIFFGIFAIVAIIAGYIF